MPLASVGRTEGEQGREGASRLRVAGAVMRPPPPTGGLRAAGRTRQNPAASDLRLTVFSALLNSPGPSGLSTLCARVSTSGLAPLHGTRRPRGPGQRHAGVCSCGRFAGSRRARGHGRTLRTVTNPASGPRGAASRVRTAWETALHPFSLFSPLVYSLFFQPSSNNFSFCR